MNTKQLLICVIAILMPMSGCEVVPVAHLPVQSSQTAVQDQPTQTAPVDKRPERTSSGLVRKTFVDGDGPTYVLLHGYGSDENDMEALSKRIGMKGNVVGYRAPIVMTTGRYAWFPVAFSSEGSRYKDDDVATAAQKVIDALEGEKKPVTLMGFSQGGMLSLYVGLSRPDLVERVVSLSGPGPLPEPTKSTAPRVFMAHGSGDLVVPVERSQQVYAELQRRGVNATYLEIEGLPHAVDDEIVQKLRTWLSDN